MASERGLRPSDPLPSPQSLKRPNVYLPAMSSPHQIAIDSPQRHHYERYPQPPAFPRSESFNSPGFLATSPPRKVLSPSASRSDGEGSEELTTKGRKRKRLAKACSACHKNKRRCDGFAPCANCEFSSRPCLYINAQGEIIPPPRTRGPTKAPHASVSLPRKELSEHPQTARIPGATTPPFRAIEVDHTLSAELIHLFFHHVHPYGAMFHSPTFHHRLYLSKVSPALLYAIYAISAHLCKNSSFLAQLPTHRRGLAFAERTDTLTKEVLARASEKNDFAGSWEETEIAQALLLLSVVFGNHHRSPYLDMAMDVLCAGSASPTLGRRDGTEIECQTHEKTRQRTFWIISIHRLCATLGSPKANVPLPGRDDEWERNGGGKHEGLSSPDGTIGEMGHAIRILSILNEIQVVSVANLNSMDMRRKLLALEQDLKTWALSLPLDLRFHEVTLSTALTHLASPLHFVSRAGWLFAFMHCIAESAMYHLQAALAPTGERWTAERQAQAVDNIMVILDAIGRKARSVPLMLGPLSVITEWHQSPNARSTKVDSLLAAWWSEIAEDWGLDRTTALKRPARISTGADVAGLGLYNTSPHLGGPGSSISTSSSLGLQTPSIYPHSVPPQARSRSNTLKSYHTVRSRSRSPDTTSWTEPTTEVRLPPLPTADLLRCGVEKATYFDLPKDDQRLSISPMNAPKTSPRFDPYESMRDSRMVKVEPSKSDITDGVTGIDALVSAAEKARESPGGQSQKEEQQL